MVLIFSGSFPLGQWHVFSHTILLFPFVDSRSGLTIATLFLTFTFVVFSTKVLPGAMRTTPNYFDEHPGQRWVGAPDLYPDFQLPMGPTLPKGTGDMVRLVVLIRIPSIVIFFCILGPLIFCLGVASTSILPSVVQYHIGRFFDAIERCASLIAPFTFPSVSTNSHLKVSQRRPIDRIIYHFIAFGQLLLFVGLHVWIFLYACFGDEYVTRVNGPSPTLIKFIYSGMVIAVVYAWILAATGRFGEIRWWPSRDRLSRLVPPSIKNATITKCKCSLLFYRS